MKHAEKLLLDHRVCKILGGAFVLIVAFVFATGGRADTSKRASAGMNPAGAVSAAHDYLPAMTLIDQHGTAVSLSSFKGKPVLVGFIHASCKGICEMLTVKMKQVAQTLGTEFNSSVAMVSITTDPNEDRPPQLLKYAKDEGVNSEGFTFLTGSSHQIDRLLNLYNVPEEGGDEATNHVLELYLISPGGSTMQKYNGMSVAPTVVASDIRKSASRH